MAHHLRDAFGRREPGETGPAVARTAGTDGRALVAERGADHGPSRVDRAEAVAVGQAHLAEEDLVEVRTAGHLTQRAHLDAREMRGQQECREPLMLCRRRVRAGASNRPTAA